MTVVAQVQLVGSSDSVAYEIVFYLHVLSAIIGFGTVFLNGLYGQQALSRRGREGAAIGQATLAVSNVAEVFIYAVFLTGLLMGIMADEPVSLGDTWLSISMLLFIIAIGISHGLLRPNVKKLNAALAAAADGSSPGNAGPETQELQIDAFNRKVAMGGGILNVIMVVILYLMVWKPGLT
jgi:hypothetical protein